MEFFVEEKETKPIKHKWVLNEEKSKQHEHTGWVVKAYVCSTCGCLKIHSRKGKFSISTYLRNGRISEHSIECVDMKIENEKTID